MQNQRYYLLFCYIPAQYLLQRVFFSAIRGFKANKSIVFTDFACSVNYNSALNQQTNAGIYKITKQAKVQNTKTKKCHINTFFKIGTYI